MIPVLHLLKLALGRVALVMHVFEIMAVVSFAVLVVVRPLNVVRNGQLLINFVYRLIDNSGLIFFHSQTVHDFGNLKFIVFRIFFPFLQIDSFLEVKGWSWRLLKLGVKLVNRSRLAYRLAQYGGDAGLKFLNQ